MEGMTAKFQSLGRETTNKLAVEVVAGFAMKNFPHMEEEEAFTSPVKRNE